MKGHNLHYRNIFDNIFHIGWVTHLLSFSFGAENGSSLRQSDPNVSGSRYLRRSDRCDRVTESSGKTYWITQSYASNFYTEVPELTYVTNTIIIF